MSFPDAPYSSAPYVQGPTSPAPTGPIYGPPYQQLGPPTGGFPVPPPRKRRSGLLIALWCVLGAGILVAFIALVAVVAPSTNKPASPASRPAVGATPASCDHGRLANGQCAEDTAAPPKTYPTPGIADFQLAVKITKKQCFGSAGCNIEFEINMAYTGPPLEPNSTWDVTFDLQGTEDSYTSTLHLTIDETGLHGTFEQDSDQMVQTKSSKTVLKPVVTSVTAA